MAKKRYINKVTPAGLAQFAYLIKPDEYKNQNKYKVNLVLSEDEASKMVEGITKLAEEVFTQTQAALKPAKRKALRLGLPFENETSKEGEETGNILFKFKSANKPDLFDAQGKPIEGDLNVGNGSLIKVAYSFCTDGYHMASMDLAGINLYFDAVQILELKGFSGSAKDYGFEEEEGFSAEEANTFGSNEDATEGETDF